MTRDIIELIANELHLDLHKSEVRDIEHYIKTDPDDFTVDIDGEEYRFIHEDCIWDIYKEGIKEITEECYLDGLDTDKHWWIAIDWEKTAQNCLDADGYGHHFATYDGKEYEWTIDGMDYYIFRTN